MKLGLFGGQKRVDEGLVLRLVHGAVDIGLLLVLGFALVIARLRPGNRHIHRVGINDRGDGVEEGQGGFAGLGPDGLTQSARGQRACGDDPMARRRAGR